MARAKRTDRADARRRYRAAQAPVADPEDDAPAPRDTAAAMAPSGGGPLGLFGGVHLPDFRGDLLAMPEVVRTTRTLWGAFALGLFAVVAGLTFPLNDPGLTGLVLPLFIQAPGIPVLVGGFVAPRGAWLIGGVMGLFQALGLLAAIYRTTPGDIRRQRGRRRPGLGDRAWHALRRAGGLVPALAAHDEHAQRGRSGRSGPSSSGATPSARLVRPADGRLTGAERLAHAAHPGVAELAHAFGPGRPTERTRHFRE